jgi:hypothetical protein
MTPLNALENEIAIKIAGNLFRDHAAAIKEKFPNITYPELFNSQVNLITCVLGNAIGNLRDICAEVGQPQEDVHKIVNFIASTLRKHLK